MPDFYHHRVIRRAWAVAVFCALVLVQHVLAQQDTAQEAAPLRILTYNVSEDNAQANVVIAWLLQQDADVIALQEVSTAWDVRLATEVQSVYPYSASIISERNRRANVTLSRYPILESQPLPELDSLYSRLCAGDREVDFYNISLETPFEGGSEPVTGIGWLDLSLRYNEDEQHEQVEQLLASLTDVTRPVVLAGDFNLTPRSGSYQMLADRLTDSFDAAGTGSGLTWPVAAVYDLPDFLPALLRIDYILHSGHFQSQAAAVINGVGSDHLPVTASLAYAPEAAFPSCGAG
jgi:endonuclease/exonuclease/phosphatase (EEP) superfamily protein YafD